MFTWQGTTAAAAAAAAAVVAAAAAAAESAVVAAAAVAAAAAAVAAAESVGSRGLWPCRPLGRSCTSTTGRSNLGNGGRTLQQRCSLPTCCDLRRHKRTPDGQHEHVRYDAVTQQWDSYYNVIMPAFPSPPYSYCFL